MENVFIGPQVALGKGVILEDNVKILGKSTIGDNVTIKSNCVLEDVEIGANCVVENSIIRGSVIGCGCVIGPFSHIRKGCVLKDGVKVGAFVEIKNSTIGKGSKIPHLSYVGDADIGEGVNVGCGVVFANYNGRIKQRSKVGDNVFIGCNVNLVAPVSIASGSYICAGTTVTKDTEEGDFVIGRVRQENKKRKKSED